MGPLLSSGFHGSSWLPESGLYRVGPAPVCGVVRGSAGSFRVGAGMPDRLAFPLCTVEQEAEHVMVEHGLKLKVRT